ncbi:hypothetical protein [Sutcliffiella deserti]|uniref:hypothetical protein n=1 Tax=Sutcliffiella deserti TaxID=2875501 RepID=UPI001CBF2D9D|nr:hypothetical protein [Sutcliffiella deserti]
MIFAFLLIFTISILLLYSLRKIKRAYVPLELLLTFFTTSYLCQNTYYKLFSPYERLIIADSGWAKINVKLFYGVIVPVLLIGVLYLAKSKKSISFYISAIMWVSFIVLCEKIFLAIGILETKKVSNH